MTKRLIPKFILFYLSLLILFPVFCIESGFTDYLPLKKLMLPYDYNEAVEKLNGHCGTFPTSFGNFNGDDHIYLSDVTGDGVEDLCTFIFFGSGMPRMDIVMLDAVNDKFYTLDGMEFRGAYGYDYRILSVEEYGIVISEKKFYPKEGIVKFGLLIFEDGELGMAEFDRDSSEYENAKAIYEKMKENGGLFLQIHLYHNNGFEIGGKSLRKLAGKKLEWDKKTNRLGEEAGTLYVLEHEDVTSGTIEILDIDKEKIHISN